MASGGLISRAETSLMPSLAILTHELRSLCTNWLVWLWLVATALVAFVDVTSNWGRLQTAPLIASLLFLYLVFPWFFVVIMLGISPVTGSRLEALADGILSRPVTRFEYLFASWVARVLVVLAIFLIVTVPAAGVVALAKRPVVDDSVTIYGTVASLLVVALVLTFLVSLSFFAGTILRRPLLSAVILVFLWFPVNLVLHTFSLEEFSPISLSQALPVLLRTPWREAESSEEPEVADEEMAEMSRQAAQFLSVLSGGAPPARKTEGGFFEQGDYGDFSLVRVLLGYGIPTVALLGLTAAFFYWRDL